jgi:hypothetical protein
MNFTAPVNAGGDNSIELFCAWIYPTTLTATRCVMALQNALMRLEVDTTTSELRFGTNWTTDGVYITSGLGLATNEWRFIALATAHENTGDVETVKVWAGTLQTEPAAVSVTTSVAAVGSPTSGGAMCIGNSAAAGTLAWQGDIGEWMLMLSTLGAAPNNALFMTTSGAIGAEVEDAILKRWIIPFWRGRGFGGQIVTDQTVEFLHCNMCATAGGGVPLIYSYALAVGSRFITPTVNGATASAGRQPRPVCWMGVPGSEKLAA